MKRIFLALLAVVVCASMTSCRHKETYRLLHAEDEITAIYIVDVAFNEEGIIAPTAEIEITDVDGFIADFREIDCYTYYGDPIGISKSYAGTHIIKISYVNGDYELINWNGQAEFTQERGYTHYAGFSIFDEDQFKALIEKYIRQ